MKIIDLTGQKYGKLQVIKKDEPYYQPSGQKITYWLCVCDCGKMHKARSIHLRRGKIQSCGNCDGQKLGESRSKLYRVWNTMHWRTSENYNEKHLYFEKGIKVCDEWQKYPSFAKWAKENGYKEGLQIDRIDNSKGYSPENCRWVDIQTNVNNRDVTFKVNYQGKIYAFTDLVDYKSLRNHESTIRQRIKNGWSADDAFDKPFRIGNYGKNRCNSKV